VESRQSLCRLQMDSGLMIQKYINFVVFNVDSTWTEWSPSGLNGVHMDSTGVQGESNRSVWGSVKYTTFHCSLGFSLGTFHCRPGFSLGTFHCRPGYFIGYF
jgi:hypothetical protein